MANEQMELDAILSDKPIEREPAPAEKEAADAPAAPVEKPAAKERAESRQQTHRDKEQDAQGRVRNPETGQYVPKEAKAEPAKPAEVAKPAEPAKPVAPAQEEMTVKEKAAFAKAADETRKRQALEAKIRELESRPAAPAAAAEPAKSFWDDPEAALAKQREEVRGAIVGERLRTSEAIARNRHTDFDEKVAIFSELATNTPGLAQQMLATNDPAEFVYRTAANHQQLREAGGMDALRAKIEAETEARVRVKMEAELTAKAAALAKERAALPGSLSEASSRGTSRPVWSGPATLEEILSGK